MLNLCFIYDRGKRHFFDINESPKRKCLLCSFAINLAYFIICFMFLHMKYESNDDLAMTNIVAGYYSVSDPNMLFPNIFLGYLFEFLYNNFPGISWYIYIYLFIIFSSFWTLGYSILYKGLYKNLFHVSILMFTVLLLYFGIDQYLSFNFTKCASLVATAGFMLILINFDVSVSNKVASMIGGGLIVLGSFIRFKAFLLVGSFAFLFCLMEILYDKDKIQMKLAFKKCCVIFIPIILLSCFCYVYSIFYDKEYFDFNNARATLNDYPLPDYYENEQDFQAIGISYNDYLMISNWAVDDPEFFNLDRLKAVSNINHIDYFSKEKIKDFLHLICKDVISYRFVFVTFVALVVSLFKLEGKEKKLIIGTLLLLLLECYYLFCEGRLPLRVKYGMWLDTFIILISVGLDNIKELKKINAKQAVNGVIILLLLVCSNYHYYKKENFDYDQSSSFLDKLSSDKNNLYLFDIYSFSSLTDIFRNNPFDVPKKAFSSNLYSIGGWLTRHPIKEKILNDYNLKNPLKDIVNNENVYLVDDRKLELKLTYIQEHYNNRSYFEVIKEIDNYKIVQFRDKPHIIERDMAVQNADAVLLGFMMDTTSDITINGRAYYNNKDTFYQKIYYQITDKDDHEIYNGIATSFSRELQENESELMKFDCFKASINKSRFQTGIYKIALYLEIDQNLYLLGSQEFSIENEAP